MIANYGYKDGSGDYFIAIDTDKCDGCGKYVEACPANINIPGYLRLIEEGKADEANALIREKVQFPGILGRVCIKPCEDVCRRNEVNESISICALKRFAADNSRESWKGSIKLKGDS